MTQTAQTPTQESTMPIPMSVLGIILDTGNVKQAGVLKMLTAAFLRHITAGPQLLSTFLIATADGAAYPIGIVINETFERQWKELYWGRKSDVTAGLQAMHAVMEQYTRPNAPMFRTLLLTDSPPVEQAAFRTAVEPLGRVEIGVLGEGETQRQTFSRYLGAIRETGLPVTLSLIEGDDMTTWGTRLFNLLD